jgi:hypothetical protein
MGIVKVALYDVVVTASVKKKIPDTVTEPSVVCRLDG